MLPSRAMPMGTEKLRITMDSRSCSAPTEMAARVPRRSQPRISSGKMPERPDTESVPEAGGQKTPFWRIGKERKVSFLSVVKI